MHQSQEGSERPFEQRLTGEQFMPFPVNSATNEEAAINPADMPPADHLPPYETGYGSEGEKAKTGSTQKEQASPQHQKHSRRAVIRKVAEGVTGLALTNAVTGTIAYNRGRQQGENEAQNEKCPEDPRVAKMIETRVKFVYERHLRQLIHAFPETSLLALALPRFLPDGEFGQGNTGGVIAYRTFADGQPMSMSSSYETHITAIGGIVAVTCAEFSSMDQEVIAAAITSCGARAALPLDTTDANMDFEIFGLLSKLETLIQYGINQLPINDTIPPEAPSTPVDTVEQLSQIIMSIGKMIENGRARQRIQNPNPPFPQH